MGNHVVNTFVLIFTNNLTTHEVSTEFLNNNFLGGGWYKNAYMRTPRQQNGAKNLYFGKSTNI